MQLIKAGSTEGRWFEFRESARAMGSPEERTSADLACFRVKRIPTQLDRETYTAVFGPKQELRRRRGEVISEADPLKSQEYTLRLANFALVDSFEAEVPAEIVALAGIRGEGMVRLDGQWSEAVKRAVFGELPALASWVVACASSLNASAAEEEKELGKTS